MKPDKTIRGDRAVLILTPEEVRQACGWPDKATFSELWTDDAGYAAQGIVQRLVPFPIGAGQVIDRWAAWPADRSLALSARRPGRTPHPRLFGSLQVRYLTRVFAERTLDAAQWVLDVTEGDTAAVRLAGELPEVSTVHKLPVSAEYSWMDDDPPPR